MWASKTYEEEQDMDIGIVVISDSLYWVYNHNFYDILMEESCLKRNALRIVWDGFWVFRLFIVVDKHDHLDLSYFQDYY